MDAQSSTKVEWWGFRATWGFGESFWEKLIPEYELGGNWQGQSHQDIK